MSQILIGLSQIFLSTVALVYLYGIFERNIMPSTGRYYPYILGSVFGTFAVINLLIRIEVAPGVIFDGRATLIALATFIGGWQAGLVSAVIFSLGRLGLGGVGTSAGIVGTLMFVPIAAGLRRYWQDQEIRLSHLLCLSFPILLQSYINILLIPVDELRMTVLSNLALPLSVFIPLGIVITGAMLLRERAHIKTQQALMISEHRFRAVFDNAFQFTGLLQPDGRIEQLNRSMSVFCNVTDETLVGLPFCDLSCWTLVPEARLQCKAAVAAAQQGRLIQYEVDVSGPDQQPRTIDFSLKPLLDSNFAVILLIFEGRDITERKAAQRQEYERALEHERVLALEQFMNETSHDLRTPITVIYTSIYLITRATLLIQQQVGDFLEDPSLTLSQRTDLEEVISVTDKVMQRLPILEDTIERFKGSVQNMTDIASSGKPEHYHFEETGWTDIISEVVAVVRLFAEQNGVDILLTPVEPSPRVRVDRSRFKSVLQNLLENAVHYSPEGGRIHVSLLYTEQWAVVEVRDRGMGISAEDLPHIFEPYYRGEQSRTVRQSGSGLGLAIVKKIVEAHDGRIEVESAVGKGSTFRVFLPRLKIASLGADVPSEAT
jgi:signal transduction histidine kinase